MASQKSSRKNKAISASDEQTFRSMFEEHSAIMLLVEPQTGDILDVNQAAVDFYGYSKSKLRGMTINEINILQPEQVAAERQKAFNKEKNYFVFPHKLANGEKRIVEVHSSLITLHEKQVLLSIIHDITNHKQVEGRISQLANELQITLDTVTVGISHIKNRRVQWANAAHDVILGYEAGETRGLETSMFYPDRESFERLGQEAYPQLLAGKTYSTEMEMQKKDGTRLWCSLTGRAMNVAQLAEEGFIWMLQDVTERKRMEVVLRESQSLYHSLVEVSPLSICRKDLVGRFTFANRRFLELSQITLADLVGKTDFDLHPSELAEKYRRDDRAILDSNQVQELIEERAVIGGETIIIQSIKTPIYDGDGKIIGIQISFWDITDRKRAEEALRVSEAMFQALFEFAPDAIVATNREGSIMRVNSQAVTLFGYRREEMSGQPVEMLIPERFILPHETHRMDYTANPSERAMGKGMEFYGRRKDGSEFPIEISLGTLETGTGTLILSVIRDITARKQVEAELRESKEILDIAHRALERSFEREQQLARTDSLTGVHNRRFLFELAEREFNIALRYRPPFSMILFDVDYFKQINDTFGHAMGDQALKKITQVVCAEIRSADVIGRYGGDEFVVLLPRTSAKEALPLAERIHASIAAMRMDTDKGPLTVTISIGIAQTIHARKSEPDAASQPDTVENLFIRADQALYAAKQAGHNRTVVFGLK